MISEFLWLTPPSHPDPIGYMPTMKWLATTLSWSPSADATDKMMLCSIIVSTDIPSTAAPPLKNTHSVGTPSASLLINTLSTGQGAQEPSSANGAPLIEERGISPSRKFSFPKSIGVPSVAPLQPFNTLATGEQIPGSKGECIELTDFATVG